MRGALLAVLILSALVVLAVRHLSVLIERGLCEAATDRHRATMLCAESGVCVLTAEDIDKLMTAERTLKGCTP